MTLDMAYVRYYEWIINNPNMLGLFIDPFDESLMSAVMRARNLTLFGEYARVIHRSLPVVIYDAR